MKVNNYQLADALSAVHLFQYHYAQVTEAGVVFNFVIHLRDVALEVGDIAKEPFFTRSVDLVTGALVTTYDRTVSPLVMQALDLHFNHAACVRDGLASLQDYLAGGSGTLHSDLIHGQATHYSDLEELYISDEVTLVAGQRYYMHNSGRVTLD